VIALLTIRDHGLGGEGIGAAAWREVGWQVFSLTGTVVID
jgi:hypothetical protein